MSIRTKDGWATQETEEIVDWFCRDYATKRLWSDLGREIYLQMEADSDKTRRQFVEVMKESVFKQPKTPITIFVWNDDFTEIVSQTVEPPKIAPLDSDLVDWIEVADYLLLVARSSWDALEAENQARKDRHRKSQREYEKQRKDRPDLQLVAPVPQKQLSVYVSLSWEGK